MAARKPRKRAGAEAPALKRRTISMAADQDRYLAAYAAWHGRTESQVIAEALAPLLKGFYVATRGESQGQAQAEPAPRPELQAA